MLQTNDMKEKLKDKNFDERTLNYIYNFVEEFDSLFGKYVSKEEVVNRIVNNLDYFQFCCDFNSSKENVIGRYSILEKKIMISKNIDNNEEEIKSIIFHEMIHCITADPKELVVGFSEKWLLENFEELNVKMNGFTEGFTEYATKIRDNKYSVTKSKWISYPILTEQVENIVSLIGEDRFFNIAFNKPQHFIKEIQEEYGDAIEFEELDNLFQAFDIIWKEEENIYSQNNIIDFEGLLINSILGNRIDSNELKFAKNTIIITLEKLLLAKSISTIDEFNKLCHTMKKYIKQLNGFDVKMYELLFDKLKDLQNGNDVISKELIEEIDSKDFRIFAKQESYINSIKKLTNKEKLIKFSNPEMEKEISDYNFFEEILPYNSEQNAKLASTIIETDSVNVGEELLYILPIGLAETIYKNNWNLDKIGLECIKLDSFRTIFNLYETNISEKAYLGTYGIDDELHFEEYTYHISNEKREKILQEHPKFDNMLLLESQDGNVVGYAGNDQYVDEYGETEDVEYCKSKEEKIVENLKSKLERFRKLKEIEIMQGVGVPQIILEAEFKQVKREIDKLKEIGGETSTILEKIEQLSVDTSIQDVCEIMEKITTSKLGLEMLEIEKDFSRLDNVENTMKEHLKEHEQNLGNLNESIEKKFDEIFG